MKIVHTMIRVGNLDRSLAFYIDVLGMRLLHRTDYPEGRFTLAFVGYCEENEGAVLELTHNWDTATYEPATLSATLRWPLKMPTRLAHRSRPGVARSRAKPDR